MNQQREINALKAEVDRLRAELTRLYKLYSEALAELAKTVR